MHAHPQALVLGRLLAAHGIIQALGDEQRIEFLCAVIRHIPGVKAVHAVCTVNGCRRRRPGRTPAETAAGWPIPANPVAR